MSRAKKFVAEFLSVLAEIAVTFPQLFIRESMHFKDLRMMGLDPHEVYRGYRNLEQRGLIRISKDRFAFTKKGKTWVAQTQKKYFKDRHPEWDGKWRLVLFDIPQELHRKRVLLRRRLKSLSFVPIQKSVWALPYPCEEEVSDICGQLGIGDYVDVITAENVGTKQDELKKIFVL